MKIMVTGGAGFIGSNLAIEFEKQGNDVTILDDMKKGKEENISEFKGKVIKQSILDINLEEIKCDIIFHQAAITDTTITDQQEMILVNTGGFKKFLDYAVDKKIPIIYASSAAVYGSALSPQSEDKAGKPNNVYGESKWLCDQLAFKYIEKYDSQILGLRYFNVFGTGEKYKGKMASMVWQLYLQMKEGKRPRIFKYGEQCRDQVYVKDVVRANILALESGKSGVINCGSGNAITFNHIIKVLNECMGTNLKPDYFENPYTEFYQENTCADLTYAKELIGYEPKWSFDDAVKDYIREIENV